MTSATANDDDDKWLKILIFSAMIPVGLEIVSELAFTFTDWGSDMLTGLADTFGLEGGIHGSGVEHAGHNHGAASSFSAAADPHTDDILMGDPGFDDCVASGGSLHFHGDDMACTP